MREYIHTTPIEELKGVMAKGLATAHQIEQWTAEPPILPSWKVVELELSDVPEFIQGGGIIRFNELELETPFDNYTTQTGERIDFSIPREVEQEISRQIKAQHKADYSAKVEQEFTKLKNEQLTKLKDSPDFERGRLNVIERWERILEGRDTDGLQRDKINLRTAWADITEGNCYIGGQRHRDRRKAMQMAAPPHFANYRNFVLSERQVDNQLRTIYINAEASHRLLQWLKTLQATSKPVTDTPTTPQDKEGSTWAEIEPTRSIEIAEVVKEQMDKFTTSIEKKGEHDKAVEWLCNYFEGITSAIDKPVFVKSGKKIELAKALAVIYRKLENTKPLDWDYQRAIVPMFDCFKANDLIAKESYNTRLHNYMTRGAKS
jgi:hypothetical protein